MVKCTKIMNVLCLLLLHQSCQLVIAASAPDDRDTFCVTGSSMTPPPVHPPNYRVLMDSFNYINLLPPHFGAVWQSVDNDTNNQAGRGTEVSQFFSIRLEVANIAHCSGVKIPMLHVVRS